MNTLTPLALTLLLSAALARAQDATRDAPAGARTPAPAVPSAAWRLAPPASAEARSIVADERPSRGLVRSLRRMLETQPDGRLKAELDAALDELMAGTEAAAPEGRQAWIDGHLGELNSIVRGAGASAPPALALRAAAAVAALNNRAERWDEGRELAGLALARDPEDAEALLARSRASAGLGDYAAAYADADRLLRRDPDASDAWTARAAASYGLGHYVQSLDDARRALALDRYDKTALALMGLSEARARVSPLPEPGLDALPRPPERLTASRGASETARALLAARDYAGAAAAADQALAESPDDPDALYFRASAANRLGRYSDAVRDATRGLIAAPSDSGLRHARAWAYARQGRYDEALADANHALELDPRDAYAYAGRARAREGQRAYEEMAADFRAAAALDARFEPEYRAALARHGLSAPPLAEPARRLPRLPARARSFLVVLSFSLAGGALIALGVLHVGAGLRRRGVLEGRYALGKSIGQGGMGVVYEAMDTRLRRPVAVKVLRDELKLDEQAKKEFMEEARTVAELHHPSIVDIHAVEEDEHGVYLIFERLEGRTLDEVLSERKRFTISEIKSILGPVCDALTYAHSRGVIHRDMKPANVMLTREGGVKVLDFGISRHEARAAGSAPLPTTATIVGTPHYMAPEQEYGVVRKENDVFSLGAVLYEMATGMRPYEGPTPAKLAKSYQRASARTPGLPILLDALVDRALEPDADKRLPAPAEFKALLDALPE